MTHSAPSASAAEATAKASSNHTALKQLIALGHPVPPATPHAVSVSLPTWQDNVGYEEADPRVVGAMQCGYPRFVFHPIATQDRLSATQAGLVAEDDSCLAFPSESSAAACQAFIQQRVSAQVSIDRIRLAQVAIPATVSIAQTSVHIVLFPQTLASIAKQFWQHTGEGISSRFAEHCLRTLGVISTASAELLADETGSIDQPADRAKATVRERIADIISDSQFQISQDNVYLFPCGMSAIYNVHRAILKLRPNIKSVQFGFPYIDTLKLQEKFGPGCHFYGLGNSQDLDALEELMSREPVSAIFCEFPSNPLLHSPDVARLSALAKKHNAFLVIDETIGNFSNTNVLIDADVIVTSLTKLFSGDSNVMAGSAVLNPTSKLFNELDAAIKNQYADGLWKEDAIVLERNSRNFVERSAIVNKNADTLCTLLRNHSKVDQLCYPKFTDQQLYLRYARNQETPGYGGLFSIVLNTADQAKRFYDGLEVHKGPSLGTNFTLASPYTILAHYTELDWAESFNVPRRLVRVAVGTEDINHLIEVFERALEQC
eukprot:jgi/Hompol1/3997/HPOL_000693-RA